ncbi:MAG: hypothetical protein OEY09_16090 [Gammaproteobacteria bacterium]|nr:hypothetical protein [Gammaproteobacteria bacterium]
MADEYLILCPVCLHKHAAPKNIPVQQSIICNKCGRHFEFQNALPDKSSELEHPASSKSSISDYQIIDQVGWSFWLTSLLMLFACISLSRSLTIGMDGPSFIIFYFLLFLTLWIGSTFTRWMWKENIAISVVAFLIFEGIGTYRLFDGWSSGMRKFELLAVFMIIGGYIFFVRARHMRGSRDGSGGCSGGGGGCGGGCGGCGG